MPVNIIMLGAASQAGLLPVGAGAIEAAIRLNGAAAERTLAAFAWGRAAVADPAAVAETLREHDGGAGGTVPVAGDDLERVVELRAADLVGYQNEGLARRYRSEVARVAAVERERGAPGETTIALAFARNLYKLLTPKDEYEVARLHLDPAERARVRALFGPDARARVLLHPPVLRALGLRRKLAFGRWADPALRLLVALRRVRGTPLDLFGLAHVRRVERALPGEYVALVDRALEQLEPSNHEVVARIAALPDLIRGYEAIKLAGVERFRDEAARLESTLVRPPAPAPAPAPAPFALPMAHG
jgi:indolepyruvate ferredoxin oxidoreductase